MVHFDLDTSATLAPPEPDRPRFDPLMPDAVARSAEDVGVRKAHYDATRLFVLAVLGGAFIAIGGLFATVVMSGAEGMMPWGVTRLLGGIVFSLGLILILIGGAQLFTGDCLMVMAWASGRLRGSDMIRVWTTVWIGNLVGALSTAAIVFLSGQYKFGHGAVGATALYFASAKASLPPTEAFFLAIMCNVLVCLAVWLALAARSVGDKILAIVFPVSAFVAAGFEHCIANMYFVPLGLMIEWGAPQSFWLDLGHGTAAVPPVIPIGNYLINLVVVTLGNWVGGAVLVGGIYWFLYRRPMHG